MDIILRKVSMLIRVSRYEFGRVITLDDVLLAKRLLDMTYEAASFVTEEIHASSQYGETKRVVEILASHRGGISKIKLYRTVQRYLSGPKLFEILTDLNEQGLLVIEDPETGDYVDKPRKSGKDLYYYRGDANSLRVTDRQLVEELMLHELDHQEIYGEEPHAPVPDTTDPREAARMAAKNLKKRGRPESPPKVEEEEEDFDDLE
jgi:hypothetical protein